jgi:glycosyltransferase involved in cell wall biosynthesis
MTISARDVTAIITVHNGERYVAEAVASVLGQRPPPGQVVVIDDGSTDATPEVLATFGDRLDVVRGPRRGQAAATDTAVGMARGSLVAFLDADDAWPPGSLAIRVDHLAGDDSIDAVYGRTVQFLSPDCHDPHLRRFDPRPMRAEVLGALLAHRSAFASLGPLEQAPSIAFGFAWVVHRSRAGLKSVGIDDVVLRRRIHDANFGNLAGGAKSAALLRTVRVHHHARRGAGPDPAP